MPDASAKRQPRPGVMLAAALALTALAYANVGDAAFVWDDHALIENDARVHGQTGLRELFRAPFWADALDGAGPAYYRPLVTASFAFDWVRSGGQASAFHWTNALVHLLAVAALFLLVRQRGAGPRWALVLAAAFGTCTRLTEAATWVSGRTDVFAGAAVLWALAVQRPGGALWRSGVAAALLLVGLLSKEVALAGVAAFALRELAVARGRWRGAAARLAPTVAAVVAWAVLRAPVVGDLAFVGADWSTRGLLATQALALYGWMFLTPWNATLLLGDSAQVSAGLVVAGVALALGVGAAALVFRKRISSEAWAGAALAAGALAPVLHLIPSNTTALAADRYLYLPLAGLMVCAAGLSLPERFRRQSLWAAAAVLLGAQAFSTHVRNHHYSDEVALWTQTLAGASSRNFRALGSRGDAWFERSLYAVARADYAEAAALARQRAALPGQEGKVDVDAPLLSIAKCDEALGDAAAALRTYDALQARRPRWKRVLYNRVLWHLRRLDWDGVAVELRKARATLGEDDPVLARLGKEAAQAMLRAEALPRYDGALEPGQRDAWLGLFDELGAVASARAFAGAQLDDGAASVEQVERAAGYLAFRGEEAQARAAIDRAAARGVVPARVEELRAALRERLSR